MTWQRNAMTLSGDCANQVTGVLVGSTSQLRQCPLAFRAGQGEDVCHIDALNVGLGIVLHLLDKLATSDALLALNWYHMLCFVLVYIELEMAYVSTRPLLFLVCSFWLDHLISPDLAGTDVTFPSVLCRAAAKPSAAS